jgi:hypothetical protein
VNADIRAGTCQILQEIPRRDRARLARIKEEVVDIRRPLSKPRI